MEARETTFSTLLNGRVQFRVPLFQRAYAWDRTQREQLWSDVLELYDERRSGSSSAQHFMGSIVTAPEQLGPNRPAMHTLIDGQQRLTTLTIMLAALRDHLSAANSVDAERIDALYLQNQFPQEPTDVYKVLPTQRDRPEFEAILRNDPDTHTSPGIRATYRYFRERLARDEDADGEPLAPAAVEEVLLDGFGVVAITLGPQDNAYRVFESLNATGLSLRQVDLIRNLFMMKLGAEQAEDAYPRVWLPMENLLGDSFDEFVHDYYLKSGEYLRADDTYNRAKARLADLDVQGVTLALDDMAWFAERWQRLRQPAREQSALVAAALNSLNRFGSDTPYPFLLSVYEEYERGTTVDDAQFAEIVRIVEGFLIRRMFLNVPTHSLSRMFIRLWHQLAHEDDPVTEVRQALAEPSRRWPRDDEFVKAFCEYRLYLDSRPEQRRLVLDALEGSYDHHERVDLEGLEIEHIMPQTLTDAWRAMLGEDAEAIHRELLHTPGNLTLTGYNPELSNGPWEDKRARYAASNLVMTRNLSELERFGVQEIRSRALELASRATSIWPGPEG